MNTEIKRISAAIAFLLLWVLVICLNFNGYFQVLTNVLYYFFSLVFLILASPDLLFFVRKLKGADSADRFQYFARNIYKLFFCVAFGLVALEVISVIAISKNTRFEIELIRCIGKEFIDTKNSVLFVRSCRIDDGELISYDVWLNATIDSEHHRVNIRKKGNNEFSCKVLN